jgi:hypothetical protein
VFSFPLQISTETYLILRRTQRDIFFSSLGATTSIFECFDLLNIQFPILTILDAVSPSLYFTVLHIISYVIFASVLWSL